MNDDVHDPDKNVHSLQVTQIGNSIGVILPEQLLVRLNIKDGEKLYAIENPDGSLRLSRDDPDYIHTMEIAERVMHEYSDTFAALAK